MAKITVQDLDINFEVDAQESRSLASAVANLLRRRGNSRRIIHALNKVTFEINGGERVGIIGPNGAGKTTLLKVMAGIYPPHHGTVRVDGRVCPLFEFATGFEMEANGWDNIRTRGLLLRMSPKEIEEKIESIAQFTGLGEFLDYPVRTYSSGMLLRLAFATSTAINPEILLLDEVMAAGDAAFIQVAKDRMNRMMEKANIVVFATHSLRMLPSFCDRSIWLDHGKIIMDGLTPDVVNAYEASVIQ